MQRHFPPVGFSYKRIRSNWREFEFMLHQIQNAINPEISLIKTINSWQEISSELAENNRQRLSQISRYSFS